MPLPQKKGVSNSTRSVYLCPSDRAARAFHGLLCSEQIAPSDCVDIENFCRVLWQRGQLFGLIDDARELLDTALSNALWRHAVSEEVDLSTSEVERIAALCAEAWALAHRHQMPVAQLTSMQSGGDNLALFARTTQRLQRLLKTRNGITQAELPQAITAHLSPLYPLLPSRIVLTPAFAANASHSEMLDSMRQQQGVDIQSWQSPSASLIEPHAHRFNDEAQEMHAAIAWASAQTSTASTNGSPTTVAIVVPDLSSKRSVWLAALREKLNPQRWWLDPETDRDCFNVSVGLPLAEYPHIASLLTLLRAEHAAIDTEALSQALSHPRWGRASAALVRIEQQQWQLLERGMDRSTLIDWSDTLPQTASVDSGALEALAASGTKRVLRSAHVLTIASAIAALTEHAMIAQSDLFQLDEAWASALNNWQRWDQWFGPLTWREAVGELLQLASEQTFQPRAGAARIQVMGLLESAGVPFAAAWFVGMTDRVLPEPYKPHPMLPLAWQTTHRVGLGSREEVRRRATALWANWTALVGTIQISYAAENELGSQRLSPLALMSTNDGASDSASGLAISDHSVTSPQAPVAQGEWQHLHDERVPPVNTLALDSRALSSSDIERQAHCPRKAAAARLRLRDWPEHGVGLSARVRGTVVHEVMAAIGEARMRGEADGLALKALAALAFDQAATTESAKRALIPALVWEIERARLLPLIDQVLALDEAREGFRVLTVEEEVSTSVFNASFKLRLDRVDDFYAADDEHARFGVLLDYKTGSVTRADWFAENTSGRLAAPQLPLYLFALHAVLPAEAPRMGAIGYLIISDDDVKFVGVGADPAFVLKKNEKSEPDWFELTMQWKDQLTHLVGEIQAGEADVAPLKGRATCRFCKVASFCREPWSLSGTARDDTDSTSGESL
jgi:ATP-dependent helicase/nuclease subunit B